MSDLRIKTTTRRTRTQGQGNPTGPPGDLATRLAVGLVPMGLARSISWDEAAYVLEALRAYDRDEAARHRRRQTIIRMGGLPPADEYTVNVDPESVPPN